MDERQIKIAFRILAGLALPLMLAFGYVIGSYHMCVRLDGILFGGFQCVETKCMSNLTVVPCNYNQYLIIKEGKENPFAVDLDKFNLSGD